MTAPNPVTIGHKGCIEERGEVGHREYRMTCNCGWRDNWFTYASRDSYTWHIADVQAEQEAVLAHMLSRARFVLARERDLMDRLRAERGLAEEVVRLVRLPS